MRQIRKLNQADVADLVDVVANAYPAFGASTVEARERLYGRLKERLDKPAPYYGLFEGETLLGAMRLHDFTMKLHSARVLVGGIGGVAVDLAYKKEKVARDLVLYFLHHYRNRGAPLTALYPFRPDFYRQMGWGYGTKLSLYRVAPANLPRGSKQGVRFLENRDWEKTAVLDCYHRYLEQTNGMFVRSRADFDELFGNLANKFVGFYDGKKLRGYLIFHFEKVEGGSFLQNDIVVSELIYETPAALRGLLAFLHTQADQIRQVVFNLLDDDFHYVFHDPRYSNRLLPSVYHESNVQGVGLMYRVIHVKRLFTALREHDFGGQSCRLRLTVRDSLLPENAGEVLLVVENGRCRLDEGEAEVAITLDVADFSSLIVGAIGFAQLYRYGLAEISDLAWVDKVDRLFAVRQKPVCLASF
ncbi:MAG: GNAT family N-acetyltransferase [Ardenticatenaceae bacterium]|nr:GNAT family N-acetyltransferase [Ardenticatenaceae bacterium]